MTRRGPQRRIARVQAANYGVYGARKVRLAPNRAGIPGPNAALTAELGLFGAMRGKARKTTDDR
jgi:putative transposase